MKFIMLINLKLLINANSFLLNIVEHEYFSANKYEIAKYYWHLHIYQQRKFHAQLSWAWKKCYNLGAWYRCGDQISKLLEAKTFLWDIHVCKHQFLWKCRLIWIYTGRTSEFTIFDSTKAGYHTAQICFAPCIHHETFQIISYPQPHAMLHLFLLLLCSKTSDTLYEAFKKKCLTNQPLKRGGTLLCRSTLEIFRSRTLNQ